MSWQVKPAQNQNSDYQLNHQGWQHETFENVFNLLIFVLCQVYRYFIMIKCYKQIFMLHLKFKEHDQICFPHLAFNEISLPWYYFAHKIPQPQHLMERYEEGSKEITKLEHPFELLKHSNGVIKCCWCIIGHNLASHYARRHENMPFLAQNLAPNHEQHSRSIIAVTWNITWLIAVLMVNLMRRNLSLGRRSLFWSDFGRSFH